MLFEIISDPWKVSGVLIPIVTFFLGFQVQKRLTRYREYITNLSHDLSVVRTLCRQACLDASKMQPCLYKQSASSLQPSDELHQIVEFPTFGDKNLLSKLKEFLIHVDSQRNIFSWGSGTALISVEYSAGGKAYYQISLHGQNASPLPDLSDEKRDELLKLKAAQLREIFEGIDGRINKLLK